MAPLKANENLFSVAQKNYDFSLVIYSSKNFPKYPTNKQNFLNFSSATKLIFFSNSRVLPAARRVDCIMRDGVSVSRSCCFSNNHLTYKRDNHAVISQPQTVSSIRYYNYCLIMYAVKLASMIRCCVSYV